MLVQFNIQYTLIIPLPSGPSYIFATSEGGIYRERNLHINFKIFRNFDFEIQWQ